MSSGINAALVSRPQPASSVTTMFTARQLWVWECPSAGWSAAADGTSVQ
jgi:hypothetical protein